MHRSPASGTWDARHPAAAVAGALVPLIAGLMTDADPLTTVVLAVVLGTLVGVVGAAKLPPWRGTNFPPVVGAVLILVAGVAGGLVAGLTSR